MYDLSVFKIENVLCNWAQNYIYNIYNEDIWGLYLAVGGLYSYLETYLAFWELF